MNDCNQCGKCCIKYGDGALFASQEEIDLWELFDPEIFSYVGNGEIWVDPKSGAKLRRCPFLEILPKANALSPDKYICGIYESRPDDCRQYPSLISEMLRDGCEMIEITDLNNPKQAQLMLERLTSDNRSS
jgi:Fe-S-cluster containining protein